MRKSFMTLHLIGQSLPNFTTKLSFFISVVADRSPSTLHSSLRWRSVGGGTYSQYFVKHSHLSSRKEKDLWLNPRKWMNLNWARICRPFKEPRNRSQPGRPVGQPYLSYRPARLHRLAESIPRNRFLGSINFTNTGSGLILLSLWKKIHLLQS
jgi:hypothetical protein